MRMLISLIEISVLIVMIVANDTPKQCPPNEFLDECPADLCRNQLCLHIGRPVPCPNETTCEPECMCNNGYLRSHNGTCVPIDECNRCPENEVLENCPSALCRHQLCSQIGTPVKCDTKSPCEPACICKMGYLRLPNGTCVPKNLCNPCPPNEFLDPCPLERCRKQLCSNIRKTIRCPAKVRCKPACVCDYGFLRTHNGTCVPDHQCTICPPNEILDDCPLAVCRNQHCSLITKPVPCYPRKACTPGCVCDYGYLRSDNGTCIPENQCKPQPCPNSRELYTPKKSPCSKDTCASLSPTFQCDRSKPAKPGCICENGFKRWSVTAPCNVFICDCPQMKNSSLCNNKRFRNKYSNKFGSLVRVLRHQQSVSRTYFDQYLSVMIHQ